MILNLEQQRRRWMYQRTHSTSLAPDEQQAQVYAEAFDDARRDIERTRNFANVGRYEQDQRELDETERERFR
jgi:hypothetical protein